MLLVIVMAVGRENIYIHLSLKDAVDQPMLPGNLPAPTVFGLSLQRLWVPQTGLWVLLQFFDKLTGLLEGGRLVPLKIFKVFYSLGRIDYVIHQPTLLKNSSNDSFGSILMPLPSAISRSASSSLAKNSSSVIIGCSKYLVFNGG